MNLYFRLFRMLISGYFRSEIDFLATSRYSFRAWPLDCDINLHLTGSRYISFMDLARVNHLIKVKMLKKILQKKWLPVVGIVQLRYLKPIKPMAKLNVETQVLSWDEKYYYIEQKFISRGITCAVGLVKVAFIGNGKVIPINKIFQLFGDVPTPPVDPSTISMK